MRSLSALLAVTGLSLVMLTSCTSSESLNDDCIRPVSTFPQGAPEVVLNEADSDHPVATFNTPLQVDQTYYTDYTTGSGNKITNDEQLASLAVSLYNGQTGDLVVPQTHDGTEVPSLRLKEWNKIIPGLEPALECATPGTRMVVAMPPMSLSAETTDELQIPTDASTVLVVDVQKVHLSRANGEARFVSNPKLPTVVVDPNNGRPGLVFGNAKMPSTQVVEVLKEGSGEIVGPNDTVRVEYSGFIWNDQSLFDTSWDQTGSVALNLQSIIPGVGDALVGKTVGSQIITSFPPELGYGDTDQGTIPPNSTLIFVVDILGIDSTGQ